MTCGIQFASAVTCEGESLAAAGEVAQELGQKLDGPADLLVVFATPHHVDWLGHVRDRLEHELAPRVLVGVTCQGVVGPGREIEQGPGLSVLAGRLPGAHLQPFNYDELDWPAIIDAPNLLHDQLAVDGHRPRALLLLGDPFSTPTTKVLPALGEALPGVPVFGGMASGGRKPGENRLLLGGELLHEGAVGVAIGGDIDVRCTVSQGCRAVGKPYVITRSRRHVVQELGGQVALEAVREVVEALDDAERKQVGEFGLHVGRVIDEYQPRFGRGDFLIRSVVGVDQDSGYLAIGDPQVRMGQTIQFHLRDARTAEQDLELLLEGEKLHGPAAGALLFTCNGRGRGLFDYPDADARRVEEALGAVPLAGFFAAGEIGPIGSQNFLHGHTASLAVFRALAGKT